MTLLKAALLISDSLHRAEQDGVELPEYLDNAWEELTIAIEANRVFERYRKCLQRARHGAKK